MAMKGKTEKSFQTTVKVTGEVRFSRTHTIHVCIALQSTGLAQLAPSPLLLLLLLLHCVRKKVTPIEHRTANKPHNFSKICQQLQQL